MVRIMYSQTSEPDQAVSDISVAIAGQSTVNKLRQTWQLAVGVHVTIFLLHNEHDIGSEDRLR